MDKRMLQVGLPSAKMHTRGVLDNANILCKALQHSTASGHVRPRVGCPLWRGIVAEDEVLKEGTGAFPSAFKIDRCKQCLDYISEHLEPDRVCFPIFGLWEQDKLSEAHSLANAVQVAIRDQTRAMAIQLSRRFARLRPVEDMVGHERLENRVT